MENNDQFLDLLEFINNIEKMKAEDAAKNHDHDKDRLGQEKNQMTQAQLDEKKAKDLASKELKDKCTKISEQAFIKYQFLI